MFCTWHELGLSRILADMAATTWLAIGESSHMELFCCATGEHTQKCLHIPYVKLASEDVALLEADPAKRQRYVELVKYTWLPPLRIVAKLVETQVGTRGAGALTIPLGSVNWS
jgi:hypothetical protein